MLREYRKLLRTIGRGRVFVLLLILRSPFDFARTMIQAVFLQQAWNAIEQKEIEALTTTCVIFGVVSLFLYLYNGTVWSIYAPFAVRMERKLRTHLYHKIATFSYERIDATTSGEWITRLNTDVEMPFSRGFHLPHAACAIVGCSMSAVILGWMNPVVLGWVILFVIPQIILTQCLVARPLPKLNQAALEHIARNTSELTALITCADVALLYDAQPYLMNRFEQSSLALLRANMKIQLRNAFASLMNPLFGLGGYLVLLMVSYEWIAKGSSTFGDLTATFQYRNGILMGTTMLINCILSIQSSMAGIRRLNETFEEKME